MILDRRNCKDCQRAKESYFELYKLSHIENQRYATIVCSIGYAAFIAILSYVHEEFTSVSEIISLYMYIFLVISIFIFILFEIWKIKVLSECTDAQAERIQIYLETNAKVSYEDVFKNNAEIHFRFAKVIKKYEKMIFSSSFGCVVISLLLFTVLCFQYFN